MKLISWNVNGIRAAMRNGFMDFFQKSNADVICLQEIKIHNEDIPSEIKQIGALQGYKSFWNGAKKKGYSGTAVIYKKEPLRITTGIGNELFDSEGRVICMEYENFFLINTYVPNSGRGLVRLNARRDFNKLFLDYCEKLRQVKPIVICGDLNVAHKEIDIANPKSNTKNAGFTLEEREDFTAFLDKGYIDTFRMLNKEGGNYTWWSYMFNARGKNVGWRIDYFLVSEELKDNVKSASISAVIFGSDHCPVELELER